MPVLHGIEVNVFHVSLQIEIIAYRVFPESSLPQASFAFRCFRAPQPCHAGKRRFNEAPSNRVVRIALGQRPDAMHVIGAIQLWPSAKTDALGDMSASRATIW